MVAIITLTVINAQKNIIFTTTSKRKKKKQGYLSASIEEEYLLKIKYKSINYKNIRLATLCPDGEENLNMNLLSIIGNV